jgi:hypothetical protein
VQELYLLEKNGGRVEKKSGAPGAVCADDGEARAEISRREDEGGSKDEGGKLTRFTSHFFMHLSATHFPSSKSGRTRRVFFSASSRRHLAIFS